MKKCYLLLVTLFVLSSSVFAQTRWADSVIAFSTEYTKDGDLWNAFQALGFPNVFPAYGDIGLAWSPATEDGIESVPGFQKVTSGSRHSTKQKNRKPLLSKAGLAPNLREFLELQFPDSLPIDFIAIYQNYNPGFVDTVYIKNPNSGDWDIVFTKSSEFSGAFSQVLYIPINGGTEYPVKQIRIAVDNSIPGWNEIDAVGIGQTYTTNWAFGGISWSWNEPTNWSNGIPENGPAAIVGIFTQGEQTVSDVPYSQVNSLVSLSSEGYAKLEPGEGNLQSTLFVINELRSEGGFARSFRFGYNADGYRAMNIYLNGTYSTGEYSGLGFVGGSKLFVGNNDVDMTYFNDSEYINNFSYFSNGGYIVTMGKGKFSQWVFNHNDYVEFPVGVFKGTSEPVIIIGGGGTITEEIPPSENIVLKSDYAPFYISDSSSNSILTAGKFQVRAVNQSPDNFAGTSIGIPSVNIVWDLSVDGLEIDNEIGLRGGMSWNPSFESGDVNYAIMLPSYYFDKSGSWISDLNVRGIGNIDSLTTLYFSNLTQFSPIAVFSNGTVPVEQSSFEVEITGEKLVSILWSTKTETQNSGWNIEWRSGSGQWNTLAFIAGAGTTTEPKNYSYQHMLKTETINSAIEYRLKQIDLNGNFSYSEIKSVEMKAEKFGLEQNYPNPFNPATQISYQLSAKSHVFLVIYDLLGREVQTLVNQPKEAGFYSVKFDGVNLPSGIYFYRLKAGNFTEIRKMTLVK